MTADVADGLSLALTPVDSVASPTGAGPAWQVSTGLEAWLAAHNVALAFSTYRANRLLLLGRAETGGLRLQERPFDRPMGLFVEDDSLWLAARSQIWRLDNHLAPGLRHEGGDRLYVPASCTVTGDVNAHELLVPSRGPWRQRLLFVNTAFSCVAALERGCSFRPVWQPPFITNLAPVDSCHLNGLALQAGEPTWATACGHAAGASSWRLDRGCGGVVLHLPSGEIAAAGLSMPHSPRWHQGRLWLLNSGSGELGWIEAGRFRPLCALPGFCRGLAFVGDWAVVGLSKLRSPQFSGLALEERLLAEGRPGGCCGLRVINLARPELSHSLDLPEPIDELFDVVALPGVRQPLALGLQGEEIDCLVRLPQLAEQVQVRPIAPSGNPFQAPMPQPFGLPLLTGPAGVPAPLAADATVPIRYQRVFHLNPANISPYVALTFPPLAAGDGGAGLQGEWLAVSAMAAGAMVGLAIAERRGDGAARLLSLMVAPPWRRRGLGTGLLLRLMRFVQEEGAAPLSVRYVATAELSASFEPILARLGWSAPQTDFLLLEGLSQSLAALDWADRHPITPPYRLQVWADLAPDQRTALDALEAPVELRPPPAGAAQPDAELSLALLHGDEPVGWLLVDRTGAQVIRCSSLFVAPAHRGRARALALLHEGFRRQQAAAITTVRAAIDHRNGAMLRLLRRHLGAHLLAIGRSCASEAPPLPAPPPRAAPPAG